MDLILETKIGYWKHIKAFGNANNWSVIRDESTRSKKLEVDGLRNGLQVQIRRNEVT